MFLDENVQKLGIQLHSRFTFRGRYLDKVITRGHKDTSTFFLMLETVTPQFFLQISKGWTESINDYSQLMNTCFCKY